MAIVLANTGDYVKARVPVFNPWVRSVAGIQSIRVKFGPAGWLLGDGKDPTLLGSGRPRGN